MSADCCFSTLLSAAQRGWLACDGDEALLSLALPIEGIDPLLALPQLAEHESLQVLWDSAPGLCLAAAGPCQELELAGSRRFEQAQRFADLCLSRLHDTAADSPAHARPRVLLRFRFFDQVSERRRSEAVVPSVQAVLPRWQLSRQGRRGWLRLNGVVSSAADCRELAEQLWLKAIALEQLKPNRDSALSTVAINGACSRPWQNRYRTALERGLELIEQRRRHVVEVVAAVWRAHAVDEAHPMEAAIRREARANLPPHVPRGEGVELASAQLATGVEVGEVGER